MEKITRSYLEKIYRGIFFGDSIVEEVEERNPLLIENDGSIQGFRFYDIDFIIDGEDEYKDKKTNYSNWIFFGKRISLDEVKTKYGNNKEYRILIGNMEINNWNYVCETQVGSFLPFQDGDMTYDEYLSKISEKKSKIILNKRK